ncbi:DUF2141 domain-containing protein [Calothrix sp. UHCC 0171]|uniref:DUF2141 domain-containing protein n=1 Tax=Calothrix sp. UHCC 0171 TaxID=3110245 RepID=UPI002B1F1D4E|nr:DUF2141 domain-containing protein [Calothrix sp. UHCC 0171]MEA5569833.1 DUF2141 domain-containing protein [Calothrix sp. UHCC 0171]
MKRSIQAIYLLSSIIGIITFSPQTLASFQGNLNIEVGGLKNQKGQVCFSLFASNKGFPDNGQSAVQARCVKLTARPERISIPNLKAGNYAVAIIHDINNDGILNKNVLGIPTEGFGFSNNPPIRTGPPKFGDSAVLVAGSSTNIQIQLQYFLGR